MNLQVFETDSSLSDPQYLAALTRDLEAYEQATRMDPSSREFDAWMDQMEQAAGAFCADCGDPIPPTEGGLCNSCWQGQRGDH